MITILADDKNQDIGKRLYDDITTRGQQAKYISISNLDVKPCYSCGACTTKTFFKCVINDDMQAILSHMANSDVLVYVCPIVFGGYSSDTKKVLDRSAILGDVHYHFANGEIVKGLSVKFKKMYAVGVKEQCSLDEQKLFARLLKENVQIMNIKGKAFVVGNHDKVDDIAVEVCS